MWRRLLGISIMLFVILSCNKEPEPDKLIDEKAVFVGSWHWKYSNHTHNYCDGSGETITDVLTPDSEGHEFRIEFLEEGRIIFYQDDIKIKENDIYFTVFEESIFCSSLSNAKTFAISYEFEGDANFGSCINSDTLRSGFFEEFLFSFEPGCESYSNYFVKQ